MTLMAESAVPDAALEAAIAATLQAVTKLKGTVKLSPRQEIEVDARGETSVPGVFAAGDVTTVPYKQIVIAMGEGSKASLSAFDYLIRLPVEQTAKESVAA